jgi:hypothetical protein
MLEVGKSTGTPALIPQEAIERLKAELLDPEGFESYEEVRLWLASCLGIRAKYDVVHNLAQAKKSTHAQTFTLPSVPLVANYHVTHLPEEHFYS